MSCKLRVARKYLIIILVMEIRVLEERVSSLADAEHIKGIFEEVFSFPCKSFSAHLFSSSLLVRLLGHTDLGWEQLNENWANNCFFSLVTHLRLWRNPPLKCRFLLSKMETWEKGHTF